MPPSNRLDSVAQLDPGDCETRERRKEICSSCLKQIPKRATRTMVGYTALSQVMGRQ